MKRSTDRILTTHVGSLPRPDDLVALLRKQEHEEPYDKDAFERTARQAVADSVKRQRAVGIDIVNDGEMSKPGYSTYITDRLTGFAGTNPRRMPRDIADYPIFRAMSDRATGPQLIRRASCVGPVAVKDRAPLERDIANLKAATAGAGATEVFMTSASPGLVTAFQPNQFYPTHEAYVAALTDALQEEYETIVKAGFTLQLDCPELALAHHTAFQDLSEAEFLKRGEQHVEALNHALRNVPADSVRLHICWGNYEGPHDFDIPLQKIVRTVLKAKPNAYVVEAANPRHAHEWELWREVKLPDDKLLMPGVIDTSTNYVEHPELVAQRICQYADIVGRERVVAATDCGFGTFAGYGKIDPEIAFHKLQAMTDGAALASRRLWRR